MSNEPQYNKDAVDQAIRSSRRKISKGESKLIHAVLRGRGESRRMVMPCS